MKKLLMAATCLTLVGSAAVRGDEVVTQQRESRTEVRRVSQVIGARVTLQRDSFGKVEDLVFNDQGCIEYVIVSYEDDYVVVPWGVVTYQVTDRVVVIDARVSRSSLRSVTFRQGRWPNLYSDSFRKELRGVWGERAFRREGAGGHSGSTGAQPSGRGRDDRSPDRTPSDRGPGGRRPGAGSRGTDDGRAPGTQPGDPPQGRGSGDRPRDRGRSDRGRPNPRPSDAPPAAPERPRP